MQLPCTDQLAAIAGVTQSGISPGARLHVRLCLPLLQGEAEGRGDISRGPSQQPHAVDRQPGREERRPPSGDPALPQEGIGLRPAKVSQECT